MRKISFLLIILAAAALIWAPAGSRRAAPPDRGSGEAQIGGPFELTSQHGKTVRDSDFRDRAMLVFFGFTHCPDICPVSVASLSRAMELLGADADRVAPVFITVDPKRDTPAAIKDYLAPFDSRLVGLTGSDEQIRQAASAYKVYYAEVPQKSDDGHKSHGAHDATPLVNHSGFIYLMDGQGKYVRHFPYDASAEEIAEAARAVIQ